jgi:hypothetical protein
MNNKKYNQHYNIIVYKLIYKKAPLRGLIFLAKLVF